MPMSAKMYLLAGAAGFAALVGVASPAAAQYPGSGYGYGNNNPVGGILGQILGYGRYPYGNYGYNQYGNNQYANNQYGGNQSVAIDQCARAVEARLNGSNGYYGYGNVGYGGNGYNQGYGNRYGNNGYNQGYGAGGRVLGITRIDRKSYGLKVFGVASSGYRGYQGYGQRGYGTYGYSDGTDLSFNCSVNYDGRIRDIDINRRTANWRGY
jgi:hypothetical protein